MRESERIIVERELLKLEKRWGCPVVNIPAHAIVEAARIESSPLHRHFQWNKDLAHEEYLLMQARQLVRVVLIERIPDDGFQRTYTSVRLERKTGEEVELVPCYVSNKRILSDPLLRDQMLEDAISEIQHWAVKYRSLEELKDLIRPIDRFCKNFEAAV